jgi:hypothetical protein
MATKKMTPLRRQWLWEIERRETDLDYEDWKTYRRNFTQRKKNMAKKTTTTKKFVSDPDYIRRAQLLNPGVPVSVLRGMEKVSPFRKPDRAATAGAQPQAISQDMSMAEVIAVLDRMGRRDRRRQMVEKATDMGYDRMAKGKL